jgi:hypothetical protein
MTRSWSRCSKGVHCFILGLEFGTLKLIHFDSSQEKLKACLAPLRNTNKCKAKIQRTKEHVMIMKGNQSDHVDFLNPKWMCEVLKYVCDHFLNSFDGQ